MVYEEIVPHTYMLAIDVFANYAIQKVHPNAYWLLFWNKNIFYWILNFFIVNLKMWNLAELILFSPFSFLGMDLPCAEGNSLVN